MSATFYVGLPVLVLAISGLGAPGRLRAFHAPVTLVGTSFGNPAVFPGTVARALGWGRMSSASRQFPSSLREVDLPVVSNSQCQAWVCQLPSAI